MTHHLWLTLVAREGALLLVLLLLGAGPAALLSGRFDPVARIALAPVLGFCLGTCLTTTLLQFWPVGDTYWILVPLAVASVGVAVVRCRGRERASGEPGRGLRSTALLGPALIVLAVAAPLTATLHERRSVGPAAYYYTDVDNYVAQQDAAQTTSMNASGDAADRLAHQGRGFSDLTQLAWAQKVLDNSNLDATTLDADVNAMLGLSGTDTYSPFLIVLLVMGGLGTFAGVRYLTGERGLAGTAGAAIAGGLFGGPLFVELWFDSYQAAIVALGLLVPVAVFALDAARHRESRTWQLLLVGLVLATLLTVYPLFLPALIATAALGLACRGAMLRRAGADWRAHVRPTITAALLVGLSMLVLDPVAVARDVSYYRSILQNKVPLPRVGFTLPLDVLPGWLGQTREFWSMPPLSTSFKQLVIGGFIPAAFLGVILVGLRRHRRGLVLVGFVALAGVIAEYSYASRQSCTYCAERNLLGIAPVVVVLIGVGLVALLVSIRPSLRIAGVGAALLVLAAVGQRDRYELIRFADSAWFMDGSTRAVLSHLPDRRHPVLVEGFGAEMMNGGETGQAQQPLTYHLVNELAPGRATLIYGSDLGNATQYLGAGATELPPGAEFDAAYRYVLTRLPGIATARRVIARSGAVALEERVSRLDVIPLSGIAVPFQRADPTGTAWMQPVYPLVVEVVGVRPGERAWARLTLDYDVATTIPRQRGVSVHTAPGVSVVCVPAVGTGPARTATLRLSASSVPGRPLGEAYPPPMPLEGVKLGAMRAVTGRCAA